MLQGFYLHTRPSGYSVRKLHLAVVSMGQAVIQLWEREGSGFVPNGAHEVATSEQWKA